MPPLEMIWEEFWQALLIPAAVAGSLFLVVARFVPRFTALGAVLAVALGFLAGNKFREAVEFRLDSSQPVEVVEVVKVGAKTVMNEKGPPPRYWLPWMAAFAGLVGVLGRLPMPRLVALLLFAATSTLAARLLVPPMLREETVWLWPALAAAILALWLTPEESDGSPWLTLSFAIAFFVAAGVCLHAHSGRFADIAAVAGGCWLGLAFVSWRRGFDANGAVPVAAILLPGLMLVAKEYTSSQVPSLSFLLAGLAPLAFLPGRLLGIAGFASRRWLIPGSLLFLAMEGYALRLAMQAETLMFE